jgi:predicted PurR-regulated permease PerM
LIATLIVLPGAFLVSGLVDTLPPALAAMESWFSGEINQRLTLLGNVEGWIGRYMAVSPGQVQEVVTATLGKLGRALTGQIQPLLQNLLATLVDFLVMIVTMAFLFKQGGAFIDFSRKMLPLKEKDKREVFGRLKETTRAIFYGVILTAFIQGIIGAVGWAMVGLPDTVLYGIAMFFSALIPFVGTALVWVPGAVYLYATGSTTSAVVLFAWGLLVVSMIDTFLKPFFIGGRARLHTLLIFFGIFGGMTAFGLKGLFLGPLVIAIAFFLGEVVRRDLLPSSEE